MVAVGHARTPPFIEGPSTPQFARHYQHNVETHVPHILHKHQIQFSSISLRRRWNLKEEKPEEDEVHTLLVDTENESPQTWKDAAMDIQEAFSRAGIQSSNVEVEICNHSKLTYNISSVLDLDNASLQGIIKLTPAIFSTVAAQSGNAWSSIAFHMRSPKWDKSAPKRATVLVFFHPGTALNFDSVETALLQVLHTASVPLRLELLEGSIDIAKSPRSDAKILRNLPAKPRNGSSISIKGNIDRAGSLGGWFYLNVPKSSPYKVALTCNHVVAQDDQDLKRRLGSTTSGFDIKDVHGKVFVEYPAALDMIATIKYYENLQAAGEPVPNLPHELENLRRMAATSVIGHVIAKSGFKVNKGMRRLDWALIYSPDPHSKNKPSPKSAFHRDEDFPRGEPSFYNVTEDSISRQIDTLSINDWVGKQGRTTNCTSGVVNSLDRIISWSQYGNSISTEIEVFGLSDDFAAGGDSGALVTNAKGNIVGMVVGKDSRASDYDIGIVTSFRELQEDIKEQTGGFLSID